MNNKKAKKIRKILNNAYGKDNNPEVMDRIYKRIKKKYTTLPEASKAKILEDSEFMIAMLRNEV